MFRAAVDFREDNDNRNPIRAAQVQMMLGHVRGRVAAVDENKRIVRHSARNPVDGSLMISD